MTKARRMMEEDIKLVDLVIEIVDARIPLSSRNPDIDKLAKNKARIVLLNKSDLADDTVTDEWITYFKDKGFYCLKLNSRLNVSNRAVNNLITAACSAKIERDRARGIKNRSIKAMIVGIPNVGKSTFINSFTGRKSAKTGNKPGVTKGKQWIRINGSVELKAQAPEFRVGDTVRVSAKIKEGNRERIQVFEGTVLKKQGTGVRATFTVRKISNASSRSSLSVIAFLSGILIKVFQVRLYQSFLL